MARLFCRIAYMATLQLGNKRHTFDSVCLQLSFNVFLNINLTTRADVTHVACVCHLPTTEVERFHQGFNMTCSVSSQIVADPR